ncbi:hypothetical protein SteCoe_33854 [Stentor coeruleus]|uniref:Ion transport domain-containing protein n=1 Tax=Stentor coeruleus TaxID=5963 RepID=A0A1R2AW07_9CILI|nr:hypothetical protein SteCoe_33854 [Stentor coeruleus]
MSRITPDNPMHPITQKRKLFGLPFTRMKKSNINKKTLYVKTSNKILKALSVYKKETFSFQVDEIKNHNCPIINHNGAPKQIFDYLMCFAILESNILTPYWLAFGPPINEAIVYDAVMQGFFFVDFICNFFTSFTSGRNKIIIDPNLIAAKYIRTWFIFDLLALMPFRVFKWPSVEFFFRLFRIAKLEKCLKIFQTFQKLLIKFFNRFYQNSHVVKVVVKSVFSLVKVLCMMYFTIYFIACCFIRFFRFNHPNFKDKNLPGVTNERLMLRTSYFISTTIVGVGYGDLLPANSSEMIAVILIILIGAMYYTVLAGAFNNIISNIKSLWPNDENLNTLERWLYKVETRYRLLPQELHKKIISHFEYYWHKDRLKDIAKEYWKAENYNDLVADQSGHFSLLSNDLKEELLDKLFKDIFTTFPNFFEEKSKLKYELCFHFQPRIYKIGEVILNEQETVLEILFTYRGRLYLEHNFNGEIMKLSYNLPRAIIGDYEVLLNKKTIVSYHAAFKKTSIPVEAFALPRKPFLMILANGFPEDELKLRIQSEIKHLEIVKCLIETRNQTNKIDNSTISETNRPLIVNQSKKGRYSVISEGENLIIQSKYRSLESNIEDLTFSYESISKKIESLNDLVENKCPLMMKLKKDHDNKLGNLIVRRK